jgi:hypothetical protein
MLLQQQQQGRKGKGKASKQQQGLQDAGQPLRNAGRGQGSWDPAGTAAAAAGPGAEGGLFSPSPQQQLWQQRQQQQASSAAEFDIDALAAAAVGARGAGAGAGAVPGGTAGPKLVETERDRMIRLGLLTPFDKLEGFEKKVQGGAAAAAAPQVRQVRFGTGAQQLQQRRQQQQSTSAHAQQQQQQQHKQQQPFEQPDAPDLSLAAEQAAAGPAAGAALPPRPRPSRAGPQHQHAAAAAVNTGSAAVADEQWALLQQRKVVSTAVPPSSAAAAAARGLGDMAHRVGRSGLPLGELMARTSQQSVEQGVLLQQLTCHAHGGGRFGASRGSVHPAQNVVVVGCSCAGYWIVAHSRAVLSVCTSTLHAFCKLCVLMPRSQLSGKLGTWTIVIFGCVSALPGAEARARAHQGQPNVVARSKCSCSRRRAARKAPAQTQHAAPAKAAAHEPCSIVCCCARRCRC